MSGRFQALDLYVDCALDQSKWGDVPPDLYNNSLQEYNI